MNYNSALVYWIYRDWTRDFRRCSNDCASANEYLEKEMLFSWYQKKIESTELKAQHIISLQPFDRMPYHRDTSMMDLIGDLNEEMIGDGRMVYSRAANYYLGTLERVERKLESKIEET